MRAVGERRGDKWRQMGALVSSGVPQRMLLPSSLFLWLLSQLDASEVYCQGLLNRSDIIMMIREEGRFFFIIIIRMTYMTPYIIPLKF